MVFFFLGGVDGSRRWFFLRPNARQASLRYGVVDSLPPSLVPVAKNPKAFADDVIVIPMTWGVDPTLALLVYYEHASAFRFSARRSVFFCFLASVFPLHTCIL